MEPNLPKSLDLTRLPPHAAKAVFLEYQAMLAESENRPLEGEAWRKAFREWVDSHADIKVVLSADSRESIYDDRGK